MNTEKPHLNQSPLGLRYFLLVGTLFFSICFGLGYPSIKRYDPREIEGLSDAANYYLLASGGNTSTMREVFHCRVLVPFLARPIYLIAQPYLRGWNAGFFALLVVNSLFCAATACITIAIGYRLFGDATLALLGAAIYLLNFAVSNLQLAGLIDAGEACFIAALTLSLLARRWYLLPLWGLLGALAKETFVPFATVLALVWGLVEWRKNKTTTTTLAWVLTLAVVGLATVTIVHSLIVGEPRGPWNLFERAAARHSFIGSLWKCLTERNFWYVFGWLIPFGVWRLKLFPRSLVMGCFAAAGLALLLGAWIDAGGSIARSVFNVTGPLLSLSTALLIAGSKLLPNEIAQQHTSREDYSRR
ncbi:MAG: hypothetical protein ABJB61_03700 [bacterium]